MGECRDFLKTVGPRFGTFFGQEWYKVIFKNSITETIINCEISRSFIKVSIGCS